MDGQTYQIKLNINVDDSQLSKAERRIRDLERGPAPGAVGVWPAQAAEATQTSLPVSKPTTGRFPGASAELPDYPTKVF